MARTISRLCMQEPLCCPAQEACTVLHTWHITLALLSAMSFRYDMSERERRGTETERSRRTQLTPSSSQVRGFTQKLERGRSLYPKMGERARGPNLERSKFRDLRGRLSFSADNVSQRPRTSSHTLVSLTRHLPIARPRHAHAASRTRLLGGADGHNGGRKVRTANLG